MTGWCVDDLLDMIYELLHYVAEVVKDESVKDEDPEQYQYGVEAFKILSKNMQFCVSLLDNTDMRLVEKGSLNMIGIVQIWTMINSEKVPISLAPNTI